MFVPLSWCSGLDKLVDSLFLSSKERARLRQDPRPSASVLGSLDRDVDAFDASVREEELSLDFRQRECVVAAVDADRGQPGQMQAFGRNCCSSQFVDS